MQEKENHILKLPVTIMRGGTSKGVYILEEDLPKDHSEWDKILLRLMGSPDQKQIDGLGGSHRVQELKFIIFIKTIHFINSFWYDKKVRKPRQHRKEQITYGF